MKIPDQSDESNGVFAGRASTKVPVMITNMRQSLIWTQMEFWLEAHVLMLPGNLKIRPKYPKSSSFPALADGLVQSDRTKPTNKPS
jgi:hypothetical protein